MIPLCSNAASYDDLIKQFVTGRPSSNTTHYFGTVDEVAAGQFEQSALSAFSYGTRPDKLIVGVHGYGFCSVSNPWGCWGANFEVTGAPDAYVHLHGIEVGVYGRNGLCTWCRKYGMYFVFRNLGEGPGDSQNEGTSAIRLGATGKTPTHHSGFQTIISLDSTALDRTVSKPYTSLVDVTESQLTEKFYLYVFPCLGTICGLEVTANGRLQVVRDIDTGPVIIVQ